MQLQKFVLPFDFENSERGFRQMSFQSLFEFVDTEELCQGGRRQAMGGFVMCRGGRRQAMGGFVFFVFSAWVIRAQERDPSRHSFISLPTVGCL